MKLLTAKVYQEIKVWMYRNARPIELALWQYYFENGSKEAVLNYLSYYQNEDGGFGNALEADSWNPNSSPYTTVKAINLLKKIEFEDNEHPIIKGIMKYLESNEHSSEQGWNFNIPSNNDYPHAPWWTYKNEVNSVEGIGVTAEIVGFIFRHYSKDSDMYNKAFELTEYLLGKLYNTESYGDMGIGGYCELLEDMEQAELSCDFDLDALKDKLVPVVNFAIVRDTSKWENYSVRPSEYITSPESIFYEYNEFIVSQELDYLIETRPQNNVWDITLSWFENNAIYAKEFAISENWWKASKAIEKMNFLRKFNRIEQ